MHRERDCGLMVLGIGVELSSIRLYWIFSGSWRIGKATIVDRKRLIGNDTRDEQYKRFPMTPVL